MKNKTEFCIDYDRALSVFDELIKRLRERGVPYHKAQVPQADHLLPANLKRDSREMAIYFFLLCLWMRGGSESDTASRSLRTLYGTHPHIFVPERYADVGEENTNSQIAELREILIDVSLGQRVDENAPAWVYNLRKLARHWQGDPRLIMKDGPEFSVLKSRLIGKTNKKGKFVREDVRGGFRYYYKKMASMLAYFLIDAKLVPMFMFPVPVDIHVMRILVSTKIIIIKGQSSSEDSLNVDFYRQSALDLARDVTVWYCLERKVSPIALCDSLWLLSRTLCRRNPGNSALVIDHGRAIDVAKRNLRAPLTQAYLGLPGIPDEVAVSKMRKKGRRKEYVGMRWTPEEILESSKMVSLMEKSCGVCPAAQFCELNIPSGNYYSNGKLMPTRLRVSPICTKQKDFLGHPEIGNTLGAEVGRGVRFAKIDLHPET